MATESALDSELGSSTSLDISTPGFLLHKLSTAELEITVAMDVVYLTHSPSSPSIQPFPSSMHTRRVRVQQ